MVIAVDVVINDVPGASMPTVTSGGTTGPAALTLETWTLSAGTVYAAVSNALTPPTQTRIQDPLAPSEIMLLTNISGTTASVTRGVEGTVPVAHTSGFTIVPVATQSGLGNAFVSTNADNLMVSGKKLWGGFQLQLSGVDWYDPAAIAWRDYGVDITNGANSADAKLAWATAIGLAFSAPLGGIRSEGIHAVDGLMVDAYAALGAQSSSGAPYGYRFPRIESGGKGGLVLQQPSGGTADVLTIRGALSTHAGPAHNNKIVGPIVDGVSIIGQLTGGHGLVVQSVISGQYNMQMVGTGGSGFKFLRETVSLGTNDEFSYDNQCYGKVITAGRYGLETTTTFPVGLWAHLDVEACTLGGFLLYPAQTTLHDCHVIQNGATGATLTNCSAAGSTTLPGTPAGMAVHTFGDTFRITYNNSGGQYPQSSLQTGGFMFIDGEVFVVTTFNGAGDVVVTANGAAGFGQTLQPVHALGAPVASGVGAAVVPTSATGSSPFACHIDGGRFEKNSGANGYSILFHAGADHTSSAAILATNGENGYGIGICYTGGNSASFVNKPKITGYMAGDGASTVALPIVTGANSRDLTIYDPWVDYTSWTAATSATPGAGISDNGSRTQWFSNQNDRLLAVGGHDRVKNFGPSGGIGAPSAGAVRDFNRNSVSGTAPATGIDMDVVKFTSGTEWTRAYDGILGSDVTTTDNAASSGTVTISTAKAKIITSSATTIALSFQTGTGLVVANSYEVIIDNTAAVVVTLPSATWPLGVTPDVPSGVSIWHFLSTDGGSTVYGERIWPLFTPGLGYPYSVDPGIVRGSDSLGMGAANQCVYWRCIEGGSVSKVAIHVLTSSGNISVAAYRNSGSARSAAPQGGRLQTSGAVACPSIGYAEVSLGATVHMLPGDWLALSADNTSAKFLSLLASSLSTQLGLGRQYHQLTAHPAPTSPASLVSDVGYTIVAIGVP